jgi:hypothetical protein
MREAMRGQIMLPRPLTEDDGQAFDLRPGIHERVVPSTGVEEQRELRLAAVLAEAASGAVVAYVTLSAAQIERAFPLKIWAGRLQCFTNEAHELSGGCYLETAALVTA